MAMNPDNQQLDKPTEIQSHQSELSNRYQEGSVSSQSLLQENDVKKSQRVSSAVKILSIICLVLFVPIMIYGIIPAVKEQLIKNKPSVKALFKTEEELQMPFPTSRIIAPSNGINSVSEMFSPRPVRTPQQIILLYEGDTYFNKLETKLKQQGWQQTVRKVKDGSGYPGVNFGKPTPEKDELYVYKSTTDNVPICVVADVKRVAVKNIVTEISINTIDQVCNADYDEF